jgi:hypothetical protein
LLLLQPRQYGITHSRGTVIIAKEMMGKKRETTFPSITNQYRNQRKIKKTDTQIQTPTKQQYTMPKNKMKPTETY